MLMVAQRMGTSDGLGNSPRSPLLFVTSSLLEEGVVRGTTE